MLTAGSHLGPYEIVTPLGTGGMGEVYRARDTRLGRDVAIKVLPPECTTDADRLHRFVQEARAASALNHPNILVVYDVGTHEGVPFLVTELLEGESLRDRLRGGKLPARKVIELVVQVCSGLAAAHEKGIVHRDLKPENLFVTRDGHVKILDFGLAKLREQASVDRPEVASLTPTETAPGVVMGTVAYMSPEQVRGEEADHRSDLFTLGVVLYEMLTGRQPFTRASGAETMAAILKEEPTEPSLVESGVSPALSRAIAHCLEKRPEERFQSARDLAFDLTAISSDTDAARTGAPSAFPRRRRRVWLAAGAAAVLIVAVGAFLLLRGPATTPGPALEPKRIVVAVFENRTGDPSLDPLGRMAADWIGQGLSQIASVEIVPTSEAIHAEETASREAGAGRRADPLRALAEQTGAGTVVSGSYYLLGQELQLQAKVTDAAHGTLIYAVEPVSGGRESPMLLLDALRQRVMGVVATHFGSIYSPVLMKPPLYDAYREYIAGLELFAEDYGQAIRHFEKAAEIDPDFFSPQIYIATAYGNQGDYARADAIVRRINENRERLTPLERLLLDWYRASLAGRDANALEAIEQAWKLAPRSSVLTYLVGLQAVYANLPQQTVDSFTRLAPEDFFDVRSIPGSWRFNVLMEAYHMLGGYERELEVANRAIRAFPDVLSVRSGKVRALAALGRVGELSRVLDDSLGVQSRDGTPGDLMLEAAYELRAHGRREAALQMANREVGWLEARPVGEKAKEANRSDLADALHTAERWDEARAIYRELVVRFPVGGRTVVPPGPGVEREDVPESVRVVRAIDYLGALGAVAARRGERGEAERVSGELSRIERPFIFGEHTYWRACIAALLGDKRVAVDLLRESFAQGKSHGAWLHRDMDLESLHGYAPFEELLRPKG